MFSDAYTTIEHGDAAALLEKLNTKVDGSDFSSTNSRIISHSLPFYNGYSLFEVSDLESNPVRIISFIYKENGTTDDLYILDGTNEPIYLLNKLVPVFLNAENVNSYVRFFFFYVRGRFGHFNIIENVDEINWREEPAPAGRRALAKMIEPLELKNEDKDGIYHLSASIVFKNSLFESDILVTEEGNVSLNNQEMLVEDIPVLDDSFKL